MYRQTSFTKPLYLAKYYNVHVTNLQLTESHSAGEKFAQYYQQQKCTKSVGQTEREWESTTHRHTTADLIKD